MHDPFPFKATIQFARDEDERDPLRPFRGRFHLPTGGDGSERIYLTGNSLGLQARDVDTEVAGVLKSWKTRGVDGHFSGSDPWLKYSENLERQLADLVGAQSSEMAITNALSVNLHVLFASFFRPTKSRFKILVEEDAFPSDRYAVESHLAWHGLDPSESVIRVAPTPDEHLLCTSDIVRTLEQSGHEISLVFLGGVNYFTGQVLDMRAITQAARDAGCIVGYDLAHAAGNVPLNLHDWNVDFAAWCTYKYINAGPGAPSGIFVHERHHTDQSLPVLRGWWGQAIADRFDMIGDYQTSGDARAYEISNPSLLALAPLKASLNIFEEANFEQLRAKSIRLTGFLEFLLRERCADRIRILTPSEPELRGAQLSVRIDAGRPVFDSLRSAGVWCDWREPGVVRMSPVPLYNSYEDVFGAVDALASALSQYT